MSGPPPPMRSAAIALLREFTRTPVARGINCVLIRAAVQSPAAAAVLVAVPLRTKADRAAAIIAAAAAIAMEQDEQASRQALRPGMAA